MEGYYLDDTVMRNEEEAEGEGREEDESQLPGFRFYPTDEELVEFYLRRKVENKPFSLDLIKEIDIYKFDPWDLPKWSTIGDNEWYFFCKRGRKYRNSVRPNRVTGSGFWKATGIDKPIRSDDNIVGLKKSLVYYTGNAGKGTKTDWMMHEFRLPAPLDLITHNSHPIAMPSDDTDPAQEAEVWTVCRIFKRNVPSRKYTSNWREIATKRNHPSSSAADGSKAKNITLEKNKSVVKGEQYISFSNSAPSSIDHQQQVGLYNISTTELVPSPFFGHEQCGSSSSHHPMPRTQIATSMAPTSSSSHPHELPVSPMDIASYHDKSNEQFATEESWDELRQFWSMFQ